jgi:hypothetical protein
MLCASRFVLLSTGAADQITFAALFVEEGIDETDFPLTSKQKTSRITQVFRNRVIKLFVDRRAAQPQFCSAQFRVEDSPLHTLRVFG